MALQAARHRRAFWVGYDTDGIPLCGAFVSAERADAVLIQFIVAMIIAGWYRHKLDAIGIAVLSCNHQSWLE